MKILMLSDFHLKEDSNVKNIINTYIEELVNAVNNELDENDELLILNIGDIIDKGDSSGYEKADQIYEFIKSKIKVNCKFAFVPGNHDLVKDSYENFTLEMFDLFTKKYTDEAFNFNCESSWLTNIYNTNLILSNSVYQRNHRKAELDYDTLNHFDETKQYSFFAVHHGLIGKKDEDFVFIKSQTEFSDFVRKYGVKYFLHGHTHIRNQQPDFPSINNVKIIGVGPAFDVSKGDTPQFNLISYEYGTVEYIERYYYSPSNKKYNKSSIETSFEDIQAISYEQVENYIPRRIIPIHNSNEDTTQSSTVLDIIKNENRIVVLGEAGNGKSCELANLAAEFSEKNGVKKPFLYHCKNYSGENIEALIPEEYQGININKIIFIFDGYDEIENQYLNKFAKSVNVFSEKNKDAVIVISSRTNFYRNETESQKNGTFKGFKEYYISPFGNTDITSYLEGKGLDSKNIISEAENNQISSFLFSPFYLCILESFYNANGYLPKRSEFMEEIIEFGFYKDTEKYEYKEEEIEENKTNLKKLLEKLGFIMQCKKKIKINDESLQNHFNSSERTLLKLSGLFKKTTNGIWEFAHNIFREYFAAKFLSNCSVEKIISIITLPNSNTLRSSWLNTISYLVLLYKDKSLLDWIAEYAPDSITAFETDKLSDDIKEKVYHSVLNNAQNKYMHFLFLQGI